MKNENLATATDKLRIVLEQLDLAVAEVEIAIGEDESHTASMTIDMLLDLRPTSRTEWVLFHNLLSLTDR